MTPKDRARPHAPPDCPREYHDDYIGRPSSRPRGAGGLMLVALLLIIGGVLYALSQAVAG